MGHPSFIPKIFGKKPKWIDKATSKASDKPEQTVDTGKEPKATTTPTRKTETTKNISHFTYLVLIRKILVASTNATTNRAANELGINGLPHARRETCGLKQKTDWHRFSKQSTFPGCPPFRSVVSTTPWDNKISPC